MTTHSKELDDLIYKHKAESRYTFFLALILAAALGAALMLPFVLWRLP